MKTTARSAISSGWVLALTALLVSPTFAEARPRQGSSSAHGKTVSHSSSSSRSVAPQSTQRFERSAPQRSVEAARRPASSPRSVQSRQPESYRAPQQPSWSRPESGPRQPAYHGPSQPRTSAPRAPSTPRAFEQPGHPQVGERQRQDDQRGWRSTPRTQQPVDGGRYSGHETRRSTDTYGDRYSGRDTRRSTDNYSDRYRRYDSQYSGHRTQQFDGRVRRMEHGTGGYRVWLDNSDHCFWIPDARFLLFPLRLGISVSFGGFWNPSGYYNVYDYGPYGGGSYGGGYYGSGYYSSGYYSSGYYGSGYGGSYSSSSTLQGYVDRFDPTAGTFVLRDDSSGRDATVLMSGGDPQFRYLQPGDWVALSGVWTLSGFFEAYRIDNLAQR